MSNKKLLQFKGHITGYKDFKIPVLELLMTVFCVIHKVHLLELGLFLSKTKVSIWY
jgi:hypothetical protein